MWNLLIANLPRLILGDIGRLTGDYTKINQVSKDLRADFNKLAHKSGSADELDKSELKSDKTQQLIKDLTAISTEAKQISDPVIKKQMEVANTVLEKLNKPGGKLTNDDVKALQQAAFAVGERLKTLVNSATTTLDTKEKPVFAAFVNDSPELKSMLDKIGTVQGQLGNSASYEKLFKAYIQSLPPEQGNLIAGQIAEDMAKFQQRREIMPDIKVGCDLLKLNNTTGATSRDSMHVFKLIESYDLKMQNKKPPGVTSQADFQNMSDAISQHPDLSTLQKVNGLKRLLGGKPQDYLASPEVKARLDELQKMTPQQFANTPEAKTLLNVGAFKPSDLKDPYGKAKMPTDAMAAVKAYLLAQEGGQQNQQRVETDKSSIYAELGGKGSAPHSETLFQGWTMSKDGGQLGVSNAGTGLNDYESIGGNSQDGVANLGFQASGQANKPVTMHFSAQSLLGKGEVNKDLYNHLLLKLPDAKGNVQTAQLQLQAKVVNGEVVGVEIKKSTPWPAGWEWDQDTQTLKIPGNQVKAGQNNMMITQDQPPVIKTMHQVKATVQG